MQFANHAIVESGAAVFDDNEPGGPRLEDCIIRNNLSTWHGAGADLETGTLLRCRITANQGVGAGGIRVRGANPDSFVHIDQCRFQANAGTGVGGLRVTGGHCLVERCAFTENTGDVGAVDVEVLQDFDLTLLQCNIWNNHGAATGALFFRAVFFVTVFPAPPPPHGSVRMVNCSLTGNSGSVGALEFAGPYYSFAMINTISWGNSAVPSTGTSDDDGYIPDTSSTVQNCLFGKFFAPHAIGTAFGDPLFVNAATGDLRLFGGSPAIDRGFNLVDVDGVTPGVQGLPEEDYGGAPRRVDGDGDGLPFVDIGSHEFQPGS